MLKAIVDTNVWVSALLTPGTARKVAMCLDANRFQLVCSDEIISELIRVLRRPKLAAMITNTSAEAFIAMVHEKALLVKIKEIPAASRDPKDDVFLACAKQAGCDFLVSGDDDLRSLKEYGQTRIVSPAEFLEVLERKE